MTDLGCKIVNWNVAWRGVRSKPGKEIRDRIHAEAADVICLTETKESFLGDPRNTICSHPDYGYPLIGERRKVLLWSRNPWTDIDEIGSADLPGGRYVKGRTQTPIGAVTFIGICIPWAAAHVSSGRRDRRRWEDHAAYIAAMKRILRSFVRDTVVLGDFNQEIPRTRAPKSVYESILDAFSESFEIATAGAINGIGEQVIDHIAHSRDLVVSAVDGIERTGRDDRQLTDHYGVSATIRKQGRL